MDKWRQQLIDTERGVFEVFAKGEGPPICVTHHYSVFNATGDYFAETFTPFCTVYLVNLREAGQSAKAEQPYQLSMLETVFDLEAVRKALGFHQWIFAGHSTGGMLGVIYGIAASASLTGLMLVGAAARDYAAFSTVCIYNEDHPEFQKMQDLLEALKQEGLEPEQRKELGIQRTKLSLHQPDGYEQYFHGKHAKTISAIRLDFFSRELQVFDVTRKLHLITVPVWIACGEHDVQCPLLYSLEMKEGIPNSQLAVFSKSNHYPFLEEKPKFVSDAQSFIAEVSHQNKAQMDV
ncbi:alpha/beta fold hydrolase [Planococcus ruber]|uniref:alpha/beta fold hydrolase n=1 Tax=Planococcus ruber TaxID=2027871 RepID=UPI001FEEFD36|nr:alpha/beta hydrolase [Planococcus ruber]MCJ1908575.1 alpha/beta hydrolase [Planococcus ruber]